MSHTRYTKRECHNSDASTDSSRHVRWSKSVYARTSSRSWRSFLHNTIYNYSSINNSTTTYNYTTINDSTTINTKHNKRDSQGYTGAYDPTCTKFSTTTIVF